MFRWLGDLFFGLLTMLVMGLAWLYSLLPKKKRMDDDG